MKTARDVILTGCSGGLIIHILLLIFDSLVVMLLKTCTQ